MTTNIPEGITHTGTTRVTVNDTARVHGSGLLDVYSTPAMVAFMEKTSMDLVSDYLEEGYGSVGISINIKHTKAVSIGEEVRCKSKLVEQDGNKLLFRIEVFHGDDITGSGTHERYIINEERFLSKLK